MPDSKYVVLAPLVQLKVKDAAGAWVFRQFYAGAVIDTEDLEVEEANLQSHVDAGQLVDPEHDVAKVFAVPAGTPLPGKPPNVPPSETGDAASTGQPNPPLSAGLLNAAGIDASGDEEWAAGSTESTAADGRPDGRSSEAKWREYHAAQLQAAGRSPEDADREAGSKSKAELVALYR